MVLGRRSERESQEAEEAVHKDHAHHLASFPRAIPLTAGPGAIPARPLIAGRVDGSAALLKLLGVIIAVVTLCFAVYLSAVRLSRLLGTTANLVFSRLLGVILAALPVQYVV